MRLRRGRSGVWSDMDDIGSKVFSGLCRLLKIVKFHRLIIWHKRHGRV
jgi:hypothetical protein